MTVRALPVAAASGLAHREQGAATGLATMTRQVGIATGTPVTSAVATAATASSAPSPAPCSSGVRGRVRPERAAEPAGER
ncbi:MULTISPECIES: hypothetical protein [unclassified Streptomyces]|uniref:hypothetical protein n=1 Tax=unclassified Streptomyces TaxID=2593676 RepID=UPI0033187C0B